MGDTDEFRRVADRVRNWGRWGDDDELGTLNLIDADKVVESASLVRHGRMFALGVDFGVDGPQGFMKWRPNPMHVMTVDGGAAEFLELHGHSWGENGLAEQVAGVFGLGSFRFNDDMIIMPLQAASQWDALSHVYYDGQLYNGFPASSVTSLGAHRCSIDKVDAKGITSRGVLLDVVRHRGEADHLSPGRPVGPGELDDVARSQGVAIGRGDIVLVRTGWWDRFAATGDPATPASGLDWRCAEWLHDHDVAAVAADNIAVEDLMPGDGAMFMAMHSLCLRDMGLMFGELWRLSELAADCAADGVWDFQLVAPPLRVTGAVGSPVNPIAIR